MNFLSKNAIGRGWSLFNITLSIVIILGFSTANLFAYGLRPWSIQRSQWDLRTLRNFPLYLVEGKGGLRVLLGESEVKLVQILGHPDRRDFNSPEILYYNRELFNGSVKIFKSRIVEIRLNVRKRKTPSLRWLTSLDVREEDLIEKTKAEKIKYIKSIYGRAKFIETKHILNYYSRGIKFIFRENFIREVVISFPSRHP